MCTLNSIGDVVRRPFLGKVLRCWLLKLLFRIYSGLSTTNDCSESSTRVLVRSYSRYHNKQGEVDKADDDDGVLIHFYFALCWFIAFLLCSPRLRCCGCSGVCTRTRM